MRIKEISQSSRVLELLKVFCFYKKIHAQNSFENSLHLLSKVSNPFAWRLDFVFIEEVGKGRSIGVVWVFSSRSWSVKMGLEKSFSCLGNVGKKFGIIQNRVSVGTLCSKQLNVFFPTSFLSCVCNFECE
jgi:hypothetical protein